jgi:hypothetical protein
MGHGLSFQQQQQQSPLIKYWLKNTKMNRCNCRYKPSSFEAPDGFKIKRLLVVINEHFFL